MALPERASSFPLGFSPFSQNDCLGTLLLNKKEVAIIMQSVASSSFNVKKKKKKHLKRKTNILSFSVVKMQLQCSLRKRERKEKELSLVLLCKMMHAFVPPQVPLECIEYCRKKQSEMISEHSFI